nr:MAG TPA: hypothetical protein [Caudoviricetes sp.]
MYKMSKRSLAGRVIVSPLFLLVLLVEAVLNKTEDWGYSVRRLRIKVTDFVDEKFPLANGKKTKI